MQIVASARLYIQLLHMDPNWKKTVVNKTVGGTQEMSLMLKAKAKFTTTELSTRPNRQS